MLAKCPECSSEFRYVVTGKDVPAYSATYLLQLTTHRFAEVAGRIIACYEYSSAARIERIRDTSRRFASAVTALFFSRFRSRAETRRMRVLVLEFYIM